MPRSDRAFVVFDDRAVESFALFGPDAQLLCLRLGFASHEQATPGRAEASLRQLQDRTGLGKDRIARSLRRLARGGVVTVVGRSSKRGCPTVYDLHLDRVGIVVADGDAFASAEDCSPGSEAG